MSIGKESEPQTKPYYEPGLGGKPRIEEEQEKEQRPETPDYSDYLGDYPSTTELTHELRKGSTVEHSERQGRRQNTRAQRKMN